MTTPNPVRQIEVPRPAVQRHADHDTGLVCRPAGYGLCVPLEDALSNLRALSDTPRDWPGAGKGERAAMRCTYGAEPGRDRSSSALADCVRWPDTLLLLTQVPCYYHGSLWSAGLVSLP